MRGLPRNSPYRLLLPAVGIDRDRVFPEFAPRSFLETAPDVVPAQESTGSGRKRDASCSSAAPDAQDGPASARRVALFVGCAANLIYPESARAVVSALVGSGVEVVIPKEQGCCGTPVFNSGDFVTAREMARRNIEVLRASGADAVVTACASCGLTLKREYEELLGIEGGLGMPVYDLTEFLAGRLDSGEPHVPDKVAHKPDDSPVRRVRVAYHDPCHLVRGQGISEEPRALLRSLPWVEYVEMRDADRCCGCGGSFSLTHYDIAKAIGQHKVEAIRDADVDVVATECQACVMQLTDMLAQAGIDVSVFSVAELLAHGPRAAEGQPPAGQQKRDAERA